MTADRTKALAFLIHSNRDINTFPAVVNAIRVYVEHGFFVDVYLNQAMKTSERITGAEFIVVGNDSKFSYITNALEELLTRRNYEKAVAFTLEGLFVSLLANKRKKIPTIYYSLELIHKNYLSKTCLNRIFWINALGCFVKGCLGRIRLYPVISNVCYSLYESYLYARLQRSGSRFIEYSIVQDELRGRLLREEFRFVERIAFVPNSYRGFSNHPSSYAFEKFGIAPNKKILLYCGGIEAGFDLDFVASATGVGQGYVLLLNAYSRDGYLQTISREFSQKLAEGSLYINRENLAEDDYDALVRSAHICFVWYPPVSVHDENMYYLGLSSGKLCKYLSCGKPVVTQNCFHGYQELIEGNGLGRTCVRSTDIPAAIRFIEQNYQDMTGQIREFYLQSLEFGQKFSDAIKNFS